MRNLILSLLFGGLLFAGCVQTEIGNICCGNGDPIAMDVIHCEVFIDGRSYCWQDYTCPPLQY